MSTPNDMITRCPKCATAFRATAQVLKIAHGTVRCGSCLHVFNAHDHPVDRAQSTSETSPSEANDKREALPEQDESWALDLLAEEEPREEIDLDSSELSDERSTPARPEANTHIDTKPDEEPSEPSESLFIDIINNDLNDELDDDELGDETTYREPSLGSDSDLLEAENDLEIDQLDTDDIDKDAIDEPFNAIEMDMQQEPAPKRWPWFVGAVVMGLVLTAQVAWLRADALSHKEPYSRYYEKACELLKCTLPVASNISKIRTSHLVVRSHPERKGVLVADAIIVNEANFAQPFPALELEFRDINNRLVAKRAFQPHEYLKGELLDATIMPVKQGVQLSLALIDPGSDAVNYQINTQAARGQN